VAHRVPIHRTVVKLGQRDPRVDIGGENATERSQQRHALRFERNEMRKEQVERLANGQHGDPV
jgi:hypothetical protein